MRLSIRALVPLDEAGLTVTAPVDFLVRPVAPFVETDFRTAPSAPDRRATRTVLTRLDVTMPSIVEFELTFSADAVGTLEFIVEGRDSKGRTIRNAIGLAVGEPAAGVHRLGAIEFPAAMLPPAEKR